MRFIAGSFRLCLWVQSSAANKEVKDKNHSESKNLTNPQIHESRTNQEHKNLADRKFPDSEPNRDCKTKANLELSKDLTGSSIDSQGKKLTQAEVWISDFKDLTQGKLDNYIELLTYILILKLLQSSSWGVNHKCQVLSALHHFRVTVEFAQSLAVAVGFPTPDYKLTEIFEGGKYHYVFSRVWGIESKVR